VQQETDIIRRISGEVKWFDQSKGFGFVVAKTGGMDILLHANVLRNFGQSSVSDGAKVEILVQDTSRGLQAVEVLSIKPPDWINLPLLVDLADIDPAVIKAAVLEPARVKWFDKIKGFGFATLFNRPEDVFLHIEVLRQSGLSDLAPGEALAVKAIDGKRGRMAVEICSWDLANTSD
jgi:CspA family cold shock protein